MYTDYHVQRLLQVWSGQTVQMSREFSVLSIHLLVGRGYYNDYSFMEMGERLARVVPVYCRREQNRKSIRLFKRPYTRIR